MKFHSAETFETVVSLRGQGLSYKQIGAKVGMTKGAVGALVLRAERGQGPAAVVDLEAKRQEITALYFQDRTLREIGRECGVSLDAISRRIRAWGLPPRTMPNPQATRAPLRDFRSKLSAPPAIGPLGDFPANACTFIAGESRGAFQCCGHPGYPYCDFHKAACYEKPRVAAQNLRVPR